MEAAPDGNVDYVAEKLTNLDAGVQYSINGTTYTADEDGCISMEEAWFGTIIFVVDIGDDTATHDDSVAQQINVEARPATPTSTLVNGTYTGAQIFALQCSGNYTAICFNIYENGNTTYAIKDNSQLVIYSVSASGLKSLAATYDYIIQENLSVDFGDAVDATTLLITTIGGSTASPLIADSTTDNFGLIKVDDVVTVDEEAVLLSAVPSGYTKDVEFHLHATVNDQVIYSTVDLAVPFSVVIQLDNFSTSKTYQVLHMKHDGDTTDDVEIFSEALGNLDVDSSLGSLSVHGLTSRGPFMVVSKSASSGGSANLGTVVNSGSQDNATSPTLDTENHFAYIQGYADGTFLPEQYITRGEAVTLINRVLDRTCDEDFVATHLASMITFTDVSTTHWAYFQVLEAANSHQYTKIDDGEIWTALDNEP